MSIEQVRSKEILDKRDVREMIEEKDRDKEVN